MRCGLDLSFVSNYQLVNNFEYKKADERQSVDSPMSHLLPCIHHVCVQLFSDHSKLSVLAEKQMLSLLFPYSVLFTTGSDHTVELQRVDGACVSHC